MSVSKQITVWCDGCVEWDQFSDTAKGARRDLKQRGWLVALFGGKDYCPICVKEGKFKSSSSPQT